MPRLITAQASATKLALAVPRCDINSFARRSVETLLSDGAPVLATALS
jgi:hypothetical protein